MTNLFFSRTSLLELFRDLTEDVKAFARQEVDLARQEMTEKLSCYKRNAISLVVGGVVAYAGLIVLLGGLGMLLSFAFEKWGANPVLANFLGLGIVGLIGILAGVFMVLKGSKAFSNASLAPERTLETIKHIRGEEALDRVRREAPSRRASAWPARGAPRRARTAAARNSSRRS